MKITRNEDHKYKIDGTSAIGVNELLILMGIKKKLPEHLASIERGQYKGKCVHKMIELELAGTLDEKSLDPQLKPYLRGFRKFREQHPLQVFEAEKFVGSKELGICGQYDCLAHEGETHILYDWTISKQVQDWKWVQVEIYKYLHNLDNNMLKVQNTQLVGILPETFIIFKQPKWSPRAVVQSLIYLYQWRKGRNLL